jgi:cbb3-type cytochrome oxidase subunit 3
MIDFLEEIFIKTWKGWFFLFLIGIIGYLYSSWRKEKIERKKSLKKKNAVMEKMKKQKTGDN